MCCACRLCHVYAGVLQVYCVHACRGVLCACMLHVCCMQHMCAGMCCGSDACMHCVCVGVMCMCCVYVACVCAGEWAASYGPPLPSQPCPILCPDPCSVGAAVEAAGMVRTVGHSGWAGVDGAPGPETGSAQRGICCLLQVIMGSAWLVGRQGGAAVGQLRTLLASNTKSGL